MKMLSNSPKRMSAVVSILTHNVNVIFKQQLIILFSLFFLGNQAFAQSSVQTDYRVGLNGRTYPIGAQIVGTFGLGKSIWGDTKTWKYGYIRGGANLMTSAVVNRAGIELQLFPISILGFTVGYDTGVRNFIPRWLDCDLYECTGRVDRKHARLNLVAAYSGFSLLFFARYEELRGFNSSNKLVFDETTLLLGNRSGENIFTMSPALLYKVGENTHVGMVSLYSRALDTGGYSHLYGPVVSHNTSPKFNTLIGLGLNSSPVVHSGFCGFFMFQYNMKPSLSVVDMNLRNSETDSTQDASGSRGQ